MGVFAGPEITESGLVLALDAANKKSYSQNEFENSTDIFAWCGNSGHNAVTMSRDTISSPVGNTPLKMSVTGNDPHIGTYNSGVWNIAPAANGQTWIVSVYAKANVATTGEILIFGANSSGAAFVNGGWVSLTGTTVSIGTEWTRVQHIHTMNSVDVAFIHTRLDGPNSGGTGQTIWWDGLQVERVPSGTTTPTPFTSSYYGGSVYRDLVGSNNGTLVNYPTYSGSNSGSLVFDGIDDNVSILYNASLKPSTAITMEAFCYIQDNSASFASLIQYPFNSASHTDPYFEWAIYFNMTSRYLHTRIDGEAASSPNNVWNFDVWTYVAITFENQSVKYYVNGSSVGSSSITKTSITYNANNPVYIGKNVSGGESFKGRLGNIKIYNRALTAQEIQQNFIATRSRFSI